MARCFVGVMVPEDVKQAAAAAQKEISKYDIDCKFVEPENMHICLSFLGDVSDDRIDAIESSMDAIGNRHGKFQAEIGGVRFIPDESYIRVIVLEAKDDTGGLERLRNDVAKEVGGSSKPSHLTLCRVKSAKDKRRLVHGMAPFSAGKSFIVDSIELIKSELGPGGPVYTVMHKSALS